VRGYVICDGVYRLSVIKIIALPFNWFRTHHLRIQNERTKNSKTDWLGFAQKKRRFNKPMVCPGKRNVRNCMGYQLYIPMILASSMRFLLC